MQVKTIMSYNFHTHRMVTCFFKKSENNSCWWGCRNTGTLFTLLVSMVALTEVFWSGVCVVSECHGRQFFFFFFGGTWTSHLPLEPHLQPILFWLFWRWSLSTYLPGLALKLDPPVLSFPSSYDYRSEPWVPGSELVFLIFLVILR
jgi:hypothetical protein